MPLNIIGNSDQQLTWTNFKAIAITAKNLPIQYANDSVTYTIWAFDGLNAYTALIWLGTVPDSVIDSGYSQSQNNTDLTDFTTNYQPNANKTSSGAQTPESTAAWTTSTSSNTAVTLNVSGYGTVTVTLNQGSTIAGGVVTFEVSDTAAGTNWYPVIMVSSGTTVVPSSTYTLVASTNISFQANVAGYVQFRVRLSTTISGTATVNVGVAANATAAEFQAAAYITDGSHGPVAVKAGSTAAAAADQSLVVGLSPNSPLPAGTNIIGALTANQSVNVAQIAGSTTSTATTGVQKVGIVGGAGTSLESTAGVIDYNLKNVNNAAVAVLGTGEQKVAVEGLAANGAALSGNPVLVGGSDGVDARSLSTDTSGRQIVVGAVASGSGVAGNPVLIAGKNSSGNAGSLITDGVNSLIASVGANEYVVQSNATVTSSSSTIITTNDFGTQQINLIINITAAPTGTTPTLTYTIQEVDPGNGTTTMGNSSSSTALSTTGVTIVSLTTTSSNVVKVSWTIGGTSTPTFTGVYTTVVTKNTPSTQQVSVTSGAATPGLSFGRVTYGASSGVLTAVRATTYTEQTTNFTGSVKSSSTNDTNSAGTGARSVTITYYDQTGAGPFTESANLNGTTAVNLVNTNHCFIEKMVVTTVGSTGSNAGTISLFTGTGGTGTTVGSIAFGTQVSTIGDNETLWAHHYTPLGKTSSIYLINAGSTGNQAATIALRSIPVLTANAAEVQISDWIVLQATQNGVSRAATNPLKVTGFARNTLYVISIGTGQIYYASFDYSDL